ncbi:TRAP transporter large permease [Arenibaculum pallidiluteum]|uniref:TRAP transporter large permease n=1 Tax=Arenibaculum pallidiluteum TaxID=2812559 RepID=UPI001A962D68|nr:TRAP transporter large permease [Arenibaculum pallidiluteum]
MNGLTIAAFGFAGMLGLMAIRMPVGLAMLVAGSAGYAYLGGVPVFLNYLKSTPYYLFSNYTISVIPLFIMMGAFAERSGLATDLFRTASNFVGHRRGGLAMAVIGACTAFGAICGSSVATTATFGRAALPELRRFNYGKGLSTGTIAVGGTLGILIPPSVILVVYAITTEQNIAKLFQAALIPGVLAALSYIAVIALVVRRDPGAGPAHPPVGWVERRSSLLRIWPAILVAVIVVGGIYGGIFTPTEGAAVGAVSMFAIGLLRGTLPWREVRASLRQTAETSAMIFLILLGAEVFNAFLALSQLPAETAMLLADAALPPYLILALILVCYIVLGAVMDELAMILLTLPVFFPIISALDFGMPPDDVAIWFGILVLMVVGIGLTAPPIGLNVFLISAIARDVPIAETYRGVMPFLAADLLRLVMVALFPVLALALVHAFA